MSVNWNYDTSILDDVSIPKNLNFTNKQLLFIREILDGKECPTQQDRLFGKLVGLNFIREVKESSRYSEYRYHYVLTDNAVLELSKLVPVSVKSYSNQCPKCGGQGRIKEYSHIAGGVCFHC